MLAQPFDGIGEIEINAKAVLAHSASFIAYGLCVPGRYVARNEVAEAGIFPFEVVIALVLGDLRGPSRIAFLLRNPDAAVVAERFTHQRQLGLIVAADGDACWMDLGEAWVCKSCATFMGAPDRGAI